MSFSTSPKDGPAVLSPPTAKSNARERAIAMLSNQGNTPGAPAEVMHAQANENKGESLEQAIQNNTIETPVVEASEPPKAKEEPLSAQYAALARKERAIRAQAQELKAQKATYEAQIAASKAKEQEYQSANSLKDRLAKDPLTVLSELGITYDQITQQALNAPSPQEQQQLQVIREMREEIKALRDAQDQTNNSFKEQQTQSYQQALNQIKSETKTLVYTDPTFETIKATNSVNDVVELIERTFQKDGILLSVEEAARAVEDHLVEEALKIARLSKIQQRLKPATPAPKTMETSPKQPQQLKTLTNATGASRQLSARERAILAFKNELK